MVGKARLSRVHSKTYSRVAALALGLLAAEVACASAVTARIERILIFDGGSLVYVWPVGGVPNPPACHGSNGNYYSFSLNRTHAKAYLAGLLAAQAQQLNVTFYGSGACTDQSVSETLEYFSITS